MMKTVIGMRRSAANVLFSFQKGARKSKVKISFMVIFEDTISNYVKQSGKRKECVSLA